MKNKNLVHSHEASRIYRHNYKTSLNPLRLLKSVLCVFISGNGTAASTYYRRKR